MDDEIDYIPSICQNDVDFYLSTKCHPNTSGRGAPIKKIHSNVSAKQTWDLNTTKMTSYVNQRSLSEQIQQATGTSYSNHSIEGNFRSSLNAKEKLEKYKHGSEETASVNSDSYKAETKSELLNPMQSVSQYSMPVQKPLSTKRRGGKREFRKLEVNSLNSEKTINDVFKTQQTFNPGGWKKKDGFQLGSKCDFPGL